ncbi:MAG: hypothetical protein ACRDO4_09910 [Nocardioides sp.]
MNRLSDRRLHRLAWASWWFFALALVGRAAVTLATPYTASNAAEAAVFLLVLVAFPLAGLLILRQQPRNTVGWLLAGIGVVWGMGGYADAYAQYGLIVDPGSLPGAGAAAGLASAIWAPALGLTGTFLFLLFPDGRLPSRRWRPLAWVSGTVLVVLTLCLCLSPDELVEGPGAGMLNPMGVEALGPALDVVLAVLIPTFALCVLAAAAGLVSRFRGARGIERLQLKWFATASAMVGIAFVLGIAASLLVPDDGAQHVWLAALDQLSFLLFALPPISIGVAVLRYRLYDIDLVINRALVYGSLTATLVATYLGSVLLLQLLLRPLTERSDLAVAASTLAVAALFGPARRRIQVAVDRRFYRHKYDAARTVAGFGARLRRELDLDAIGADLVRIADDAVQPTAVSLWLDPAVTVPGRVGPRKDTP